MALSVTTDHNTIMALLDAVIAVDPVRATTLGTIRNSLADTAWAASDGVDQLAVRSAAQFPVVLSGRWSPGARAELIALLGALPDLRGVAGVPDVAGPIVSALCGADRVEVMSQRLFRLDELADPSGAPGAAVRASAGQRDLVRAWYRAFADEAHAVAPASHDMADASVENGGCWLWVDRDVPVSMAVRRPVVAGTARIGPVYTPPERRGRGYGSAVTAAATRDILADGAIPLLFTDLANPTSNKIYQALGYRPVEDRILALFPAPRARQ